MLTATLAVVALAGALSTGTSPSPALQTNYTDALSLASSGHKPLAVFLGHDGEKLKRMIADGTISAEAAKILHDSYVCVCLDVEKGAGKELADRVKITEGLVISNSTGGVEALRDRGTVTGTDLTRQLGQFASTGTVSAAPRMIVGGCANGTCNLTTYGTTYTPVQSYGTPVYGTVYGSSCPNGRCPLQQR